MDQATVTRAEKEALNVFHDLQLAHTRSEEEAPKRTARLRISAQGNILKQRRRTVSRSQAGRPASEGSR